MSLSEEFIEAFITNTTGCVEFCDCGKIHFHDSQEWDWEKDELENLRINAEEDEMLYMAHHDYIKTISFNGGRMVIDCQCNNDAEDFESMIMKDSLGIARYLKLLFAKQKLFLETIKDFNEL